MIKSLLRGFALATAMSAVAFAAAKNPVVGGAAMFDSKNIIENAVNSKDHTTLVAAVKAAGLVGTACRAAGGTVFMAGPR